MISFLIDRSPGGLMGIAIVGGLFYLAAELVARATRRRRR